MVVSVVAAAAAAVDDRVSANWHAQNRPTLGPPGSFHLRGIVPARHGIRRVVVLLLSAAALSWSSWLPPQPPF